jgi:tetratricopeptide (TPR) repeat protein
MGVTGTIRTSLAVVCAACVGLWQGPVGAQGPGRCPDPAGRIVSVQGAFEVRGAASGVWRPATLNEIVCPGDSLFVGLRGRGAVQLLEIETVLHIDENSTIVLPGQPAPGSSFLELLKGAVHFLTRTPRKLEVGTPFLNAGVEGTEFLVRVDAGRKQTFLTVFEGTVAVAAGPAGVGGPRRVELTEGQSALGQAGTAPRLLDPGSEADRSLWRYLARPRGAVQWSLYYRPVLAALADPSAAGAERALPPAVRDSFAALGRGDLKQAFDRLDAVPEAARDDRFHLYRAGLLLSVGRFEEASLALDRALVLNPRSGEAHALLAVIAVAQNEAERATVHGEKAVAESPRSPAARIALSYARQANFDLEAARDELLRAAEVAPDDGLAWARLAEIHLSLGYLGRALAAAETAVERAPNLGLTQVVLGFARLAQIDTAGAKAAFERAVALDSADPMARLGLGLAKIRVGDLVEGRREIEVAAGLDPNDAVVRSYLGKAYFEEKREEPAARQFDLAKQEDPNDPTPYLYDAIRKQTENRPVEALQDIQKSIELNDNRAVYRSRLLLDEDLAARGARLGNVYRDLGFEQLALVEGWKSVNADPGNHSAHRLLADTYSVLPRHEIASDSELLQSRLLQPANVDPVRPRLLSDGLAFLDDTGLSGAGFNEFSPLFASNGLRLDADGVVGNRDTLADSAIVSGIYGNVSFSVGQSHFETDGIRQNHDLSQNIYSAFLQYNPFYRTSVQIELRSVDEESGDRSLLFDPDNFFSALRRDFDTRSIRVGFRQGFAPNATLIGSYVHRELDDDQDGFPLGPATLRIREEDSADFFEVRHLQQLGWLDLTAGLGYLTSDRVATTTVTLAPFPPTETRDESDVKHWNGYVYGSINYLEDVILTLGASVESFESSVVDRDQVNPKVGLVWNVFPDTTLRAAAFRTLKRTLTASQTIEPTQVAGFNQFFDDDNGTQAWRYGVGLDQKIDIDRTKPGSELYLGVEASRRDLEVPIISASPPPPTVEVDWEEEFARAYLNWTPSNWLALGAEYRFERFDRGPQPSGVGSLAKSRTHKVPLTLRFFHPSGLFAGTTATFVDQEGRFADPLGNTFRGSDSFWTVDASLGYRFPKRRGAVTVEVRNLFDQDFNFQDSDPANPLIVPERLILGRLTLAF